MRDADLVAISLSTHGVYVMLHQLTKRNPQQLSDYGIRAKKHLSETQANEAHNLVCQIVLQDLCRME